MKNPILKKLVFGLLILLIITFSASVVIWMQMTMLPSDIALNALQTASQVKVSQESGLIIFEPMNAKVSTGFIFYSGAGVDYRSYAPLLRQISLHGYVIVVPSMPLNLAFFNMNVADQIVAKYPNVENWAIGGHSLGGGVAASYMATHTSIIDGLILWAAYPNDISLKNNDISVLSIYGSLDGLATPQKINESRSMLPPSTVFIEINGGNHSQFGSYGFQSGDNTATISPEAQWIQIVDATVKFLIEISK